MGVAGGGNPENPIPLNQGIWLKLYTASYDDLSYIS